MTSSAWLVTSKVRRDDNERRKIAQRRRWHKVESLKSVEAPSNFGRAWQSAMDFGRIGRTPVLSVGYESLPGKKS